MDFLNVTAQLYDLLGDRAIADRHRVLAGRYVRDWFGCYMAGGATDAGKSIREYAGKKPDPEMAVFSTAALSKLTESDDIHHGSMTQPGCVVIPTAMILGRNLGKSCNDVLDAVITGYEVMIRMGEAMGNGGYNGTRNTATAGVFASAAVASRLMNAGRDEFVRAMDIAGRIAPGAVPFGLSGQHGQNLQAGHAAQSGCRAAMLAARGLSDPQGRSGKGDEVWEKQFPGASPGRILSDASSWKIGETSIKPYPSCRHTHSAIDAVLEIRRHLMDKPFDGISSIKVTTTDAVLKSGDNPSPADSYAARYSLQYNMCTALLMGIPGLEHYENDHLNEVLNHPLMKKLSISSEKSFISESQGKWACGIDVIFDSGKTLSQWVDTPRGDPENPLPEQDLDEKVIAHLRYAGFTSDGARVLLKPFREITIMKEVPECWWHREDTHQTFMN
jgi:2-methylcitrate dehydratase PrpD